MSLNTAMGGWSEQAKGRLPFKTMPGGATILAVWRSCSQLQTNFTPLLP